MSTYWHKQANGRKGKTLPWSRKSLTNVEWLLENQHFATITVMTDPGKKDQWKLKPLGETLMRKSIFTYSQSISPKFLINFRGKWATSQWRNPADALTELKVLIIDKWTLCSCRRGHPENDLLRGVSLNPGPVLRKCKHRTRDHLKNIQPALTKDIKGVGEREISSSWSTKGDERGMRTVMGDPGLDPGRNAELAKMLMQLCKKNKKTKTLNKLFGQPNS